MGEGAAGKVQFDGKKRVGYRLKKTEIKGKEMGEEREGGFGNFGEQKWGLTAYTGSSSGREEFLGFARNWWGWLDRYFRCRGDYLRP